MWDSQDLAKRHAEDVAKHAEDGRGLCQACLRAAKQAYTSQVPTELNKWICAKKKVNGIYFYKGHDEVKEDQPN